MAKQQVFRHGHRRLLSETCCSLHEDQTKDQTATFVQEYMKLIETQSGKRVKYWRIDGGGEFLSTEMQKFLKSKGITLEITNAGTPQENGVAERGNRTIMN